MVGCPQGGFSPRPSANVVRAPPRTVLFDWRDGERRTRQGDKTKKKRAKNRNAQYPLSGNVLLAALEAGRADTWRASRTHSSCDLSPAYTHSLTRTHTETTFYYPNVTVREPHASTPHAQPLVSAMPHSSHATARASSPISTRNVDGLATLLVVLEGSEKSVRVRVRE
jgi:hypothetical protein